MLTDTLRILARRWKWVVAVLIIALAAGVGTYKVVPPSYESKAEVLFLPPLNPPGGLGIVNPYTNLDSTLSSVGAVVQSTVLDEETQQKLYRLGDTAKYTIAPNTAAAAGPTILITVTDKSAQMAQKTLSAVIVEILSSLNSLQANASAPAAQYVTAVTLTATTHATTVHKTQIQLSLVAVGGLLFLLLVTILLADRAARRRRDRRALAAEQRAAEAAASSSRTVGSHELVEDTAADSDRDTDLVTVRDDSMHGQAGEPVAPVAADSIQAEGANVAGDAGDHAGAEDGIDRRDETTDQDEDLAADEGQDQDRDDEDHDDEDQDEDGQSGNGVVRQPVTSREQVTVRALMNRPRREIRRITASGTPPAGPKL